MAHAQETDVVFRRKGRVHLNRRGASVHSTTGSRDVRTGGSNVGYTMFRGSVKSTGYPLHSPVSSLFPLPCDTVCHYISTGLQCWIHHAPKEVEEYWLPTPLASFPLNSPPVRHCVPSHFNWTLPQFCPTLCPLSAVSILKTDTTKTTLIFGLSCHLLSSFRTKFVVVCISGTFVSVLPAHFMRLDLTHLHLVKVKNSKGTVVSFTVPFIKPVLPPFLSLGTTISGFVSCFYHSGNCAVSSQRYNDYVTNADVTSNLLK
jgi:hypothetical protein